MSYCIDMGNVNGFYNLKYEDQGNGTENGGVKSFDILHSTFNKTTTMHGIPSVTKAKGNYTVLVLM